MSILGRGRAARWTKEKVATLTTIEVKQLRANAERLQETELASVCDEVLKERPRGGGPKGPAKPGAAAKKKRKAPVKARSPD